MNTMSLTEWIFAATASVAAVIVLIALVRTVLRDGYGTPPSPDPRHDWGTSTLPSSPYTFHR
jgi:hypothetical protein